MKHTREYQAIRAFYGERTARRSGVRLMNHIDEGLLVLQMIGASEDAKRAFCLHPLFQADPELTTVGEAYLRSDPGLDVRPVMLTMEYRQWANAWLSDKVIARGSGPVIDYHGEPSPGPLLDVRHMLIADKVQNYKDFLQFHAETHDRRYELRAYFIRWLGCLQVSVDEFERIRAVLLTA